MSTNIIHMAVYSSRLCSDSALCFKRHHAINCLVASWSRVPKEVTCKKCLAILSHGGLDELEHIRPRPGFKKYKCKHCKQVVLRDSNQAWIKSICEKTGKIVHLTRVK